MPKSIEFFSALAYIEHGPEKNTVLETLSKEVDDFHLFTQVFEPGVVYASINWKGVLGHTASVAAIGSLVWSIYIDKVEPLVGTDQSPKPALLIMMKDAEGNWENISLGGDYTDKEIFIGELTEKVERLRKSEKIDETILETYETSKNWIKVK
ncbi:hypothetical protein [Neptunomonas qingdaonensis]|uniref:Uncharacterized protein n=1 Tax=Neptunomonas qingdaonensis TaxID=1045558 RepID=A0A1I2S1X7_9GAMM|nr:hypothetical protein [Neptunomonas qingdaonensis]SFG46832.1 hypothetical protein SAMN05216175_10776 [Neptunomonas qingdaonensis]